MLELSPTPFLFPLSPNQFRERILERESTGEMEKHRCKLCCRSFANGRALGGHMRSHMLNLYVPPKTEQPSELLGEETESAQSSSSSSSSEEEEQENEEEEDGEGLFGYGLRENPKKSIRLVHPEFSFSAANPASSSVVLDQDRESEAESSKNHPILRRRSKRIRKSGISEKQFVHDHGYLSAELKKPKLVFEKFGNKGADFSCLDAEPVSSISDTTPEEDVAYCLMMLSRDKWRREKNEEEEDEGPTEKYMDLEFSDEEREDDDESDQEEVVKVNKSSSRARGKYRCETCNKVFQSYQALGGHRASHKRIKSMNTRDILMAETEDNAGGSTMVEEKIHECPVCYRVFSSGQALGGHKRSHAIANNNNNNNLVRPLTKHGATSLIDLNLPAPIDDEFSQIELSAVSDTEFVHPMKR